jgi:hypothetical protein
VEELLLSATECRGGSQIEIYTSQSFVPESSASEVKVATGKLNTYRSSGANHISSEMIQVGGGGDCLLISINLLCWSGIKKNCLVSGKSKLSYLLAKEVNKTDYSNYRGTSLQLTSYKIISSNLLSRLIPYADEIIPDQQRGFRRSRSTTDQIVYIRQILEKIWKYNGTVHQLIINLKRAYDSLRRDLLYNILNEFGIPRKLVGIIKIRLNETYSRVRIGKNLSDGW